MKKRSLEEVVQVINEFVNQEIEERQNAQIEYETTRKDIFNEIDGILGEVETKRKLHIRKASQTKDELAVLIDKQNKLADQLILINDSTKLSELEKEMGELSARRLTLEAKIKAFTDARNGLLVPEERMKLNEKIKAFDEVQYQGKELHEMKEIAEKLKRTVALAVEPMEKEFRMSIFYGRNKPESALDKLTKQDVLELFANGDSLALLKKHKNPEYIFSNWLKSPESISFGEFIPNYLENERLANEKLQREQDERKLKEAREREKRNAKAAAAVEARLGGGHYF